MQLSGEIWLKLRLCSWTLPQRSFNVNGIQFAIYNPYTDRALVVRRCSRGLVMSLVLSPAVTKRFSD